MPISANEILVNRCYQTAANEVRRVTAITPAGEVNFTSFDAHGEAEPVEGKQMAGEDFAREVEMEVACPA